MRIRYGSYALLAILFITLGVCGGLAYAQPKPASPEAPLPSYDRSMDAAVEGLVGPIGGTKITINASTSSAVSRMRAARA